MKAIILPEDVLKHLEKRFGPAVRQMGSWNTDGTFAYSSIPIVAVEKAAEVLDNPTLLLALFRLDRTPDRTKPFIELLEAFGPALIDKIAAAFREFTLS